MLYRDGFEQGLGLLVIYLLALSHANHQIFTSVQISLSSFCGTRKRHPCFDCSSVFAPLPAVRCLLVKVLDSAFLNIDTIQQTDCRNIAIQFMQSQNRNHLQPAERINLFRFLWQCCTTRNPSGVVRCRQFTPSENLFHTIEILYPTRRQTTLYLQQSGCRSQSQPCR